MCGRYTLTRSVQELAEHFEVEAPTAFAPRYNIAPTQPVPVVRFDPETGRRRLEERRWGLVPHWTREARIDARLINARVETVSDKAAFREAFRLRRCLLPADGFYEWATQAGRRRPHHVHRPGRGLFAFAGLYERWRGPEGRELASCSLLTGSAAPALRELHERMPLVLTPERYAAWLDPAQRDPVALHVLLGAPVADWLHHPVTLAVNDPRHEGADCMQAEPEPAEADAALQP